MRSLLTLVLVTFALALPSVELQGEWLFDINLIPGGGVEKSFFYANFKGHATVRQSGKEQRIQVGEDRRLGALLATAKAAALALGEAAEAQTVKPPQGSPYVMMQFRSGPGEPVYLNYRWQGEQPPVVTAMVTAFEDLATAARGR